jgi:hypothetical protein
MNKLLNGVSAIALVLVATPAFAFNEVDWSWDNEIDQKIHINIGIDASNSFYPTGLTQLEQLQVSAGNISAYSNQNDTAFNVNRDSAGGPVTVDLGSITVKGTFEEGGDNHPDKKSSTLDKSGVNKAITGLTETGFSAEKNKNEIDMEHKIKLGSITVNVPGGSGNLDARYDLGRLEGNATAAANLASINSDVMTTFHDGQIAFGSFGRADTPEVSLAPTSTSLSLSGSENRNFDALVGATLAGLFGVIQPGTVSAYATATDVTDAQIALNATAAGNLHTVTNGPAYPATALTLASGDETVKKPERHSYAPAILSDSIVIGDLNQFSLMNVSATADGSGLTVTGYNNLGKLKDQYGNWVAVSSVNASAFGNMSSVTNRVGGLSPLPYAPK